MEELRAWFDARVVPLVNDWNTQAEDLTRAIKDHAQAIDRQRGDQRGW